MGPGKKLPFRTTIGTVPPGYTADVTLSQRLQSGIDYELTVGGGESFYEKTTFRLEDLHAGEVLDFSGDVRPAGRFIADTRCG